MNEPTVCMSGLDDRVVIDNYVVDLPATEHFIVVAGANYFDAATHYDHPSIAAKPAIKPDAEAYRQVKSDKLSLRPAHVGAGRSESGMATWIISFAGASV